MRLLTTRSRAADRSRGRRVAWLGGFLALGLLLLLAWGGWQAWQGARQLERAAADLQTARSSLGDDPLRLLRSAAERTTAADRHLSDPVVRALSAVPLVGDPLRSASGIAAAADLAVRGAGLPLAEAAGQDPAERLVPRAGTVDLEFLSSLSEPVARATDAVEEAQQALASAPADTVVDRVDAARTAFAEDLAQLTGALGDVAAALEVAPELLGQDTARRYLVVSQSPAEARGTGGLIGGFSLLEARDGALRIVRSGPRAELQSPGEPVIDLGKEFDDHYGFNGATRGWINSNLSPHFPYAAMIWMELWERQHGEQLDGAIVLDPIALSYLLEATGAITLPDGTVVDSGNVVDLTMRDVYARFGGSPAGDAFLQAISTSVAAALTTRELDGVALVRGLERSVSERRLLLWSADEQVQSVLADEAISGTLPEDARAVGDVIVDAAGSKLDYYLERDLAYVQGCDDAPSTLTLTLTNAAPAQGLPDYVTPEGLRGGKPPGTNTVITTLYLPSGSVLESLRVDGTDVGVRQGTELRLPWVELFLDIAPGASREVVARFEEVDGEAPLKRVTQPLVRPETFSARGC